MTFTKSIVSIALTSLMSFSAFSAPVNHGSGKVTTTPIINYINDYGGQVYLSFNCSATQCQAQQTK